MPGSSLFVRKEIAGEKELNPAECFAFYFWMWYDKRKSADAEGGEPVGRKEEGAREQ